MQVCSRSNSTLFFTLRMRLTGPWLQLLRYCNGSQIPFPFRHEPGDTNTSNAKDFAAATSRAAEFSDVAATEMPDCSSMIPEMSVTVSIFTRQRA
jgi:hypothetical protein